MTRMLPRSTCSCSWSLRLTLRSFMNFSWNSAAWDLRAQPFKYRVEVWCLHLMLRSFVNFSWNSAAWGWRAQVKYRVLGLMFAAYNVFFLIYEVVQHEVEGPGHGVWIPRLRLQGTWAHQKGD